jgi:hypothetical protein
MGLKRITEYARQIAENSFKHESYTPCENETLLKIFDEERKNMDVTDRNIELLVSQAFGEFGRESFSFKSKEGEYKMVVFPHNIAKSKSTSRSIIRHQLAHIKHGDLERHLTGMVKWFYRQFIAEPRARSYE